MVKTAPETAPASPPSPAAARSAPGTPTAGGGGGAAAPAPASSAPPPAAAAPAAPAPAAAGVFKSFHSKIGASLVRAMSVTKADGGAGGGGGGGDGPPSARGQPPAGLGGDVALYGQQAGPRPGAGGPLAAAANALLQCARRVAPAGAGAAWPLRTPSLTPLPAPFNPRPFLSFCPPFSVQVCPV